MAVAQERRRGKPFRRLLGLLVFLAVLWCGAWAAAYFGANWAVDQAEALASPESRCSGRAVGGFPLTIEVGCGQASVQERFLGVAANITGLTASVPLYYPLRVDARAAGPLEVSIPDSDVRLALSWTRAATSTEAWPFGEPGISRFAADVEGLAVSAEGSALATVDGITAERGSILVAGGEAPDSLAIVVRGEGMDLRAIAGEALPKLTVRVDLEAPGFGSVLTGNLPDQLRSWLSLGGRLQVGNLEAEVGGVRIGVSGPLTIGPDGFVSGTVQLRFAGIDRLPALVEALDPGAVEEVTQIAGILDSLASEVNGERVGRVDATIANGEVSIGFIRLPMRIPSIFSLAGTV